MDKKKNGIVKNSNGGFSLHWDSADLMKGEFRRIQTAAPISFAHKNRKYDTRLQREQGRQCCREY